MANKANKVKYGLKDVHYALATFDEDGEVTYGAYKRIPGAVSLSLDPEGEPEIFWADSIAYFVMNNNGGYTGELEIALVPEDFLADILHEERDANGVLSESADVEIEHFALAFCFQGDQRHVLHVLYNCTCSRPGVEGATTEDTKEPQTETLSLTATALANGYVKSRTGADTPDDVYENWFNEVYLPVDSDEPKG